MYNLDVKDVMRQANGRWFYILTKHGIDGRFLKNKNCPCPKCGGKNRFRWDNKNGDGGGYCHQCDMRGSGLSLLGKWLNLTDRKDFSKLLEIIATSVGYAPASIGQNRQSSDNREAFARRKAKSIWDESLPLTADDPSDKYLRGRGLKSFLNLESLRTHSSLEYFFDDSVVGRFPALVGKITDAKGNFLAIHRTYLDASGIKASVPTVKMMLAPVDGGSIQFGQPTDLLNVAEGIETALAVLERTAQPTWAAMTAGNLEKIVIPSSVTKVVIWADLDLSRTGEHAAHALARRLFHLGVASVIKLPVPRAGVRKADWLDIHVQESGEKSEQ